MRKYILVLTLVLAALCAPERGYGQKQSLRLEAPSILWGHVNLDYGVALAPKWSLHLAAFAKPLTLGLPAPIGAVYAFEHLAELTHRDYEQVSVFGPSKHWVHVGVEPGVRYWFNGVYNRGVFLGGHVLGKLYRYGGNKLESSYREGYALGGFVTVGYSRELAPRWNMELELGLGAQYRSFDRYSATGAPIATGYGFVPSISRFGVQVVYLL